MKDEEFQELLRKGKEALDLANQAKTPIRNLPSTTDDSLSRGINDIHNDIHNDYLKSSEQTRQHLNDLHARTLRIMDIKIDRAKASTKATNVTPAITARELIKQYRVECKWTQAELAEQIKVTVDTVSRHESGRQPVRLLNLRQYDKAFSGKLNKAITLPSA